MGICAGCVEEEACGGVLCWVLGLDQQGEYKDPKRLKKAGRRVGNKGVGESKE